MELELGVVMNNEEHKRVYSDSGCRSVKLYVHFSCIALGSECHRA
jgi:hypothetical protein